MADYTSSCQQSNISELDSDIWGTWVGNSSKLLQYITSASDKFSLTLCAVLMTMQARRIVQKHDHKGFREMEKRVTFQRDEYTTPNAHPSHQVLKIDVTDKVLSTAPVPLAQNKPIGSSTSAVISG